MTFPEEVCMPAAERRWAEQATKWVEEKRSVGRYRGRNGYEAVRFLSRCGEWVRASPAGVTEGDVWAILAHIGGSAPKTRRFYLAMLGSFLASPPRSNYVIQASGVKARFPNETVRTPVVPADVRDAVIDAAIGMERVVLALLSVGRRPVEIVRARVEDVTLAPSPGTMLVRGKGGGGDATARVALNRTVRDELAWYLPLRARWAEQAETDSGRLICRWEGAALGEVSVAFLRRRLADAERRAGAPRYPLYSFRRGTATLLRARGAEWEDVRDALTHKSIGTTEGYVSRLLAQERAPRVMALLDRAPAGERP